MECGAAFAGQAERGLAAILSRGRTLQQAGLLKFTQDAAQIAGIHAQLLRYLPGEWLPARSQLVEHSRLAEGIWRVEQTLLQSSDDARVQAGESAKCCGLLFQGGFLAAVVLHKPMSANIVDIVKYCREL